MKKILLLHGWNDDNYTSMTKSKDAWHNRKKFVDELSKEYDIYKLNFPGFCGEKEPKQSEWNLEDYANYVKEYLDNSNLKVDYILGYSFGGAVAVEYASMFDNKQKLILVSPAIIRNYKKTIKFIKTPKCFRKIRNSLRNSYLKYIIKNEYIIHGTKFLNNSYQNIVRVNLINQLEQLNPYNITIIYGTKDNMVNPEYINNNINIYFKNRIFFIKDGTHDIANTNTKELIDIIKEQV